MLTQNKKTFIVATFGALLMAGCASTKTVLAESPINKEIRAGDSPKESSLYSFYKAGASDNDIRSMFWLIATEGKKYGAQYFEITYPIGLKASKGAPFTSVDEVLSYCEEATFGKERPRCSSLNISLIGVKFYKENNQENSLMWSIDDVLADKKVSKSSVDYSLNSYPREVDGEVRHAFGSTVIEKANTD